MDINLFFVHFLVPEVILIRRHWLSLESKDFFERRDWFEGDVPIAVELRRVDVAGVNVTRPS